MRPLIRALQAIAPGALVALPSAMAVTGASERAAWAALGRDQGIFQYIAWAVSRGDVLYRDVRDVNGPLVALIHRVGLALGAADEHRFRVLDLSVTAVVAALAGGSLVSLDDRASPRWERVARALSLGVAAWAVLTAQYLAYDFWQTAQRESLFDWFVLTSIALQMTAQSSLRPGTLAPRTRRLGTVWLALAGGASVMPWFGKPTYILFTLGQLVALAVDDLVVGRARRTAIVAVGGFVGAIVPIAFLLQAGDVRAWARITFVDVPAMYRFIWPRPFGAILRLPGYDTTAMFAVAASASIVLLVLTRLMPRRALPLAVMPLGGLASVAIQAKGFPYHFHPVTAGTAIVLVALVHLAWTRAEQSSRVVAHVGAGLVAILLGARTWRYAEGAPYADVPLARDAQSLASADRLALYERVDFSAKPLHDAAAYVASHTAESDRVQMYGMDPYLLFLARRRSATPYIYAYDLDADAALHGGFDDGAPRPTQAQVRAIKALRDAHERDLVARLEAAPPAAFVLIDRSPLMSYVEAERDFEEHCPDAYAWVRSRYLESAVFEGVHVWLRLDAAP